MNYVRLYNRIIEHYSSDIKPEYYVENHHILPRCMGGSDDPSNLVYLPPRVHYICHRLLCKIHPYESKLKFAFWAMSNQLTKREYRVTSHSYSSAKKAFAEANSKLHKGKTLSPEHINVIRQRCIDNNPNKNSKNKGKKRPDSVVASIKETKKRFPERNPQYKGRYVTPQGTFSTAYEAARSTTYAVEAIRRYCNNPDRIISRRMVANSPNLTEEHVGMRLREIGWDFLPE